MSRASEASDSPTAGQDPIVEEATPLQPQRSEDVSDKNLKDAGNKPSNHYKERLSPLRFKIRQMCLPLVRKETEILALLQGQVRHPALDFYFAWTANMASHTFYVLMLPLPIWFGASQMVRDLVFVLGMGIYVTGFCKDFLCLPRPRSPPLHRITMLSYTAQEYGWPSSHAANATAVTLVLIAKLFELRTSYSISLFVLLLTLLTVYYFSLIVGRLYCGMHGFFDILSGSGIGLSMFLFRRYLGHSYDDWLLYSTRNSSWAGIFATVWFIILGHLYLIHIYPEPVDDCPCFDDSVAFVGVLIGLDLAHYVCVLTNAFTSANSFHDAITVPYSPEKGWFVSFARVVVGMVLVVIWKSILKPVLFTVLPPLYKLLGVHLPRSNFISAAHTKTTSRQIRSQSLSNMKNEPMIHLNDMLKVARDIDKDVIGPMDDIDAYELLDYQLKHPEHHDQSVKISGVFRPRYDVEIIGRTIVYAGIAVTSVWGFALVTLVLGLA